MWQASTGFMSAASSVHVSQECVRTGYTSVWCTLILVGRGRYRSLQIRRKGDITEEGRAMRRFMWAWLPSSEDWALPRDTKLSTCSTILLLPTFKATAIGRLCRSLWISVLGRGFLLTSRLQRRFSLCSRCWSVLEPCVPKQLNTDNRLHDPRLCGCSRRTVTHHYCRPNVQPVTPKMVTSKNLSPKCMLPKRLVAQTSVHLSDVCEPKPVFWTLVFAQETRRPSVGVESLKFERHSTHERQEDGMKRFSY